MMVSEGVIRWLTSEICVGVLQSTHHIPCKYLLCGFEAGPEQTLDSINTKTPTLTQL